MGVEAVFQKISMKRGDSVTGNERQFSKAMKCKFFLPKYYTLSDECGLSGMVSIIFIYLVFSFGQQPYIPEESSQMVVPSGH